MILLFYSLINVGMAFDSRPFLNDYEHEDLELSILIIIC